MPSVKIPILNNSKHPIPAYATVDAAGMDIYASLPEGELKLSPLERKCVPTGISIALPKGYEAQIRPRSGLAHKHGITVLNSPGTIDADFRGEIKVLLINLSQADYTIQDGDRIAQIIIKPYTIGKWVPTEKLNQTARGAGGYGSTGMKKIKN